MRSLHTLFVLCWILMLPFSNVLGADNPDPGSYESKLQQGIEAFYETDWEKASTIFKELRSLDKNDPRAYFFEAMIPFWDYFFGGSSAKAATSFLERSSKAIEVSEQRLKKNPHDTTMVLMLSGLHGYRSLVAAGEKNYQTAISSGMRGFSYTRQLLALDDDDPRALIGKGVFYYMMGSVPGELRWATNLAGLKGDMEQGYAILEQAASSESYVSNDARMILSFLYKRDGEYQQALRHIRLLCDRYPQNIIFQYHYAELLSSTDHQAEARKAYQKVVQMPNKYLSELKIRSRQKLEQL